MGSSGSSSTDLSPEEERVFIKEIAIAAESNSKEGDTFYLIAQRYIVLISTESNSPESCIYFFVVLISLGMLLGFRDWVIVIPEISFSFYD